MCVQETVYRSCFARRTTQQLQSYTCFNMPQFTSQLLRQTQFYLLLHFVLKKNKRSIYFGLREANEHNHNSNNNPSRDEANAQFQKHPAERRKTRKIIRTIAIKSNCMSPMPIIKANFSKNLNYSNPSLVCKNKHCLIQLCVYVCVCVF